MEYISGIILATLAGLLARWYMLRGDYRQYPSYPQGWAIHLFLGFIGALLGAILVPSFLEGEFAAASFVLLAAAQFREVRNIERNMLERMEQTEMVPRGAAYIEGIARVFEARNYLSIFTAIAVSIAVEVFQDSLTHQFLAAIIVGTSTASVLNSLMRGQSIGDIAEVEIVKVKFDDAIVVVGDVYMMNIGLEDARRVYLERAIGALIKPKGPNAKATLANLGQMQAIAHDVSSMIGIYMDVGEQEFTPIVRRNPQKGILAMVMVPSEENREAFLEAVKRVPVLEAAVRKPLKSAAGQMMD